MPRTACSNEPSDLLIRSWVRVVAPPWMLTASKPLPALSRRNRETRLREIESSLTYGESTMQKEHLLLQMSVRCTLRAFMATPQARGLSYGRAGRAAPADRAAPAARRGRRRRR